ncbi:hypothetical protein KFL_001050120 [Klebsormidium nitens]|uniref:EGF-like domain-containing protein n=1 Tax=Klebsormidium nitens TaxID=105231 RepID=A0A1Y1I293_KLENI|nr:hypothetical protein KFL_001050120 [Klebsormidium nitens]|eukprot:GAQ82248.1 hypothetical protein KFL_001050120 [Klebsormidium nitens]
MMLRCTVALFLIASCLSLPTATLSQFSIVDYDFSCGTGFIPVQESPTSEPDCYSDPCYGNPGPCGAGNQCTVKGTTVLGLTILESVCTCPAPSVVSHIVYVDFCYVPGTDRCNPNPCKNGGTCEAVTDFNGVKGAFVCTCPPTLEGTTCELPSRQPRPIPIVRNGTRPPTPPPTPPPSPAPTVAIIGDQGVCGKPGEPFGFPVRCYFNSDPQGRYVCCDNQGCNGFNADNLTPRCKNYGHVPFNFGLPVPTIGDQATSNTSDTTCEEARKDPLLVEFRPLR